jgi:hypothetical protein
MKISNIIEILLIIVVIILTTILVISCFVDLDYKIMARNEYDYNAYKYSNTEDSITMIKYIAKGNPVKQIDKLYLKDGKIVKMVEEYYYDTIYNAKQVYENDLKNYGNSYKLYITKNIIIHEYDNPKVSNDTGNAFEFDTNEDLIKYAEENLDSGLEGYTRVY